MLYKFNEMSFPPFLFFPESSWNFVETWNLGGVGDGKGLRNARKT